MLSLLPSRYLFSQILLWSQCAFSYYCVILLHYIVVARRYEDEFIRSLCLRSKNIGLENEG